MYTRGLIETDDRGDLEQNIYTVRMPWPSLRQKAHADTTGPHVVVNECISSIFLSLIKEGQFGRTEMTYGPSIVANRPRIFSDVFRERSFSNNLTPSFSCRGTYT
jgi:hypothetical protein